MKLSIELTYPHTQPVFEMPLVSRLGTLTFWTNYQNPKYTIISKPNAGHLMPFLDTVDLECFLFDVRSMCCGR